MTHTILAPWQLAGERLDTRRPHRVDVGGGRSIVVVAYDAGLSTSVSFEIEATSDADRFAWERVVPRLAEPMDDAAATPFALIATDGELYGHHQAYRDLFLRAARRPGATSASRSRPWRTWWPRPRRPQRAPRRHRRAELVELPSRRRALGDGVRLRRRRRVEGAVASRVRPARRGDRHRDRGDRPVAARRPRPWAARDAYVDVVIGAVDEDERSSLTRLPGADAAARRTFATLMAAQRWRLAMYASCGWFWETPGRSRPGWSSGRPARRYPHRWPPPRGLATPGGGFAAVVAIWRPSGSRCSSTVRCAAAASRRREERRNRRSRRSVARNPSARGLRATG